jgi:hypothetical protein
MATFEFAHLYLLVVLGAVLILGIKTLIDDSRNKRVK